MGDYMHYEQDWKFYQTAVIPATPPHLPPLLTEQVATDLFHRYPKALLIRWYSDYDCPEETDWWYCIKDTTYDIEKMKSRHRYEITKARRYFEVRKISAKEYAAALYDVQVQSMRGYPERDRHPICAETAMQSFCSWDDQPHLTVFGAFSRESGQLCGFAMVAQQGVALHLSSQKANPDFEKYGVNAALVDGILTAYNELLAQGYYICDGARNVLHQTHFQDYLGKYFGFRKAYCRLHIRYRAGVGVCVKLLSLFRGLLKRLDHLSFIHKINGILTMERYQDKPRKATK